MAPCSTCYGTRRHREGCPADESVTEWCLDHNQPIGPSGECRTCAAFWDLKERLGPDQWELLHEFTTVHEYGEEDYLALADDEAYLNEVLGEATAWGYDKGWGSMLLDAEDYDSRADPTVARGPK